MRGIFSPENPRRDINGIFSQETYLTNRVSDVMIDKDIIQENKRIRKRNSCTRTGKSRTVQKCKNR